MLVIERWRSKHLKASLPSIAELWSILEQPLPENEKIPITSSQMSDLVSSRSEMQDICTDENVSFWDRNVCDVLELLVPRGNSIRNISHNTATRSFRPDYAFLVGDQCLFRGEEKAPGNNENPKAELSTKLLWAYDLAPYVFGMLCLVHDTVSDCSRIKGYYSTGADLTLVAIISPSR